MQVQRVSANIGVEEGPGGLVSSDVPDLDASVPPSRNEQVLVILVELDGEDSVGVARLSSTTALQGHFLHSLNLIIHSHDCITTSCGKSCPIWLIVNSQELVQLVVDSV